MFAESTIIVTSEIRWYLKARYGFLGRNLLVTACWPSRTDALAYNFVHSKHHFILHDLHFKFDAFKRIDPIWCSLMSLRI